MTKLSWADLALRQYSAGVDRGVLYPSNSPGVPWNGLISVESTEGVVSTNRRYYDGQLYANALVVDSFSASVSAYTYPEELDREFETFGLSYRTKTGKDHYVLHLVYQAIFGVTDRTNTSVDVSPTADTISWDLATLPIKLSGAKPTAHVTIDTRQAHPNLVLEIEDILYGTSLREPRLPLPEELLDLFETYSTLRITDHGDGTWTAEGPDEAIDMLDATTFAIDWPSARYLSDDTYTIHSL